MLTFAKGNKEQQQKIAQLQIEKSYGKNYDMNYLELKIYKKLQEHKRTISIKFKKL